MLNITNTEKLQTIANQAIAKTLVNCNEATAARWMNAICNALVLIEQQAEFMTYDEKENYLLIWSQTSNEIYAANGVCQCKAFELGFPCKHRAAARLVRLYLELPENTNPVFPEAKKAENTELPCFVNYDRPKAEKVGGIRIN